MEWDIKLRKEQKTGGRQQGTRGERGEERRNGRKEGKIKWKRAYRHGSRKNTDRFPK